MHHTRTLCFVAAIAALLGGVLVGADVTAERLGEPVHRLSREPIGAVGAAPADAESVDGWNRSAVVSRYYTEYVPALSVPMQWSGSVPSCTPGTTSQAYIDATFEMINYYRGMVGLADATNATSYNANAQAAALMMSANGALSHSPPPTWTCYSPGGAAAAGSSNLALGSAGPSAIALYMRDPGSYNTFVGHRRWILYPMRNSFGTGSVGESTTGANALVVFTPTVARPADPAVVAWPPVGYVPYQVVYPRWSMALNTSSSVSFAAADVAMTEDGSPVSLSVVSRTDNGYGDNTIVWEPSGLTFSSGMQDRRFTVTVSGISGPQSTVVYEVVVIDPAVNPVTIFEDGFESATTGAWSDTVP